MEITLQWAIKKYDVQVEMFSMLLRKFFCDKPSDYSDDAMFFYLYSQC